MIEKEYIDLEETVTTLKRNSQKYFSSFHKGYVQAIEDLADIPAAKVAPVRHGFWVAEYDCGYTTPHCSECGEIALTKEETNYDYVYSSYCPHCGARMDEKGCEEND